jgi:hypothetical protein
VDSFLRLGLAGLGLSFVSIAMAQNPPAPLPTPSMTGPLQQLPPASFDAGPLGRLNVNGVLSGTGLWQSNHAPGDAPTQAALATPFLPTDKTLTDFFGPVPIAYLKLAPAKNTSILIGSLPALIGAEYTFTFENMNIERGLLWNQEPAVSRGKFSASLSWNDGFYSNRYSWLSGALTLTVRPHSLEFVAGGNLSQTRFQTAATPVQNNRAIYDVIYTYSKGHWVVQPYFQYTTIVTGASTRSGAVLVSRSFGRGFSLAGRWEYLGRTGSVVRQSANLLFGSTRATTFRAMLLAQTARMPISREPWRRSVFCSATISAESTEAAIRCPPAS